MITAALDFIHARKWLVELILFLVIAGGIYLFCQHLIVVGTSQERARWEAKLKDAEQKAAIETARLTERAAIAEKARAIELTELDSYRASHPLHGRLCQPSGGGVPGSAAPKPVDAGTSAAAAGFLAMPEGHSGTEGGRADQQYLLDLLAARADQVSAGLREWQSR